MNSGVVLVLLAGGGAVFLLVLWVALSATRGGGRASAPTWRPEFGDTGTPERPFVPTVSGPGIAIDDVHGWLWVATEDSGYKLLDRSQVRTWRHEWSEWSNGRGALELWHNKLTLGLNDVRHPMVKVDFGRDHALAEQWQARLTAWLSG